MASFEDFEELEDEVKELLKHYKHKKATIYEPCTLHNYEECLIGLYEEFGYLNISYIFNPHLDIENKTLRSEALVKLINATYTLLHQHKNKIKKVEVLTERNQVLESTTKHLNATIENLKQKINSEKNESRACIASAQRISDHSEAIHSTLAEAQAKLTMVTRQKQSKEKGFMNEIARLKKENEKLNDKLRSKSGSFTPCAEVCDASVVALRERERRQRALITKLQENNRDLLQEVLALKEEIILGGLTDYRIGDKK